MVVSNFPRAKTQSLTSPEGAMTFYGTYQTFEKLKKKYYLGVLEATRAQDPPSC